MSKRSHLFTKLPERALVWEGLSFYQRAVGTELFRFFQERVHTITGDWKRIVCMRLGVPGTDRANVHRALEGMVEAGVIAVSERSIQLLYSQEAIDAHLGSTGGATGGSTQGPVPVHPGSTRGPLVAHSLSTQGPLPVHSASSARNDSTVPAVEEDREIERRRVREHVQTIPPPEPPNPGRFRWELEELVRAEFSRRGSSAQKASDKQWRDGCQTVQEALDLGVYPDARSAMLGFAESLVDACAGGEKLGFALQQVQLGAQLKPPVAGGRQLSQLAQETLRRRAEGL